MSVAVLKMETLLMTMKILILEQEKTIKQSLTHLMEGYRRFEVFTANSLREGQSLFQAVPFDVVLCGHRLPDGDGLELLKDFMGRNPRLISLLMTSQSDESVRREAEQAGILGYLEKPFDLTQLEELIGVGNV